VTLQRYSTHTSSVVPYSCGAPGWLLSAPRGSVPGTALERVHEIDRPVMFAQKTGKSFIGNLLKTHHPVSCQHGERLPGRVIELDASGLFQHNTGDEAAC
jgi:hypothetical protein